MPTGISTISIPKDAKARAKKASEEIFGRVNFSGYIQYLIKKDCDERKIK